MSSAAASAVWGWTLTFSAFQPKRPTRSWPGDGILDEAGPSRDPIAIAIPGVRPHDQGALVDGLEQTHPDDLAGHPGGEGRLAPVPGRDGDCRSGQRDSHPVEGDRAGGHSCNRSRAFLQLQLQLRAQIARVVELDGHQAVLGERAAQELARAVLEVTALAAGGGEERSHLAGLLGERGVRALAVLAGAEVGVKQAAPPHQTLHVFVLDVERHLAELGLGQVVGPDVGGVSTLLRLAGRSQGALAVVGVGVVGGEATGADLVAEGVGVIGSLRAGRGHRTGADEDAELELEQIAGLDRLAGPRVAGGGLLLDPGVGRDRALVLGRDVAPAEDQLGH
jgi:hypothetical protein